MPLMAETHKKAVGKGVGEKEFGELLSQVEKGGLKGERQLVNNWDREERIWSKKTWVLAPVLPSLFE